MLPVVFHILGLLPNSQATDQNLGSYLVYSKFFVKISELWNSTEYLDYQEVSNWNYSLLCLGEYNSSNCNSLILFFLILKMICLV